MDDYGNPDTGPIWRKIDENRQSIHDLAKDHAAMKQRQDDQDRKLEAIHNTNARIEAQLNLLNQNFNQAQGGLKLGKWLFWAGTVVAGLAVAVWKIVTIKVTNDGGI